MGIIDKLSEKPWLTPGLDPAEAETGQGTGLRVQPSGTIGLTFIICIITIFFLILTVTYVLRMGDFSADPARSIDELPSWSLLAICGIPPAQDWTALHEPMLLWINTLALIVSSLVWEAARRAADAGRDRRLRDLLLIGGGLGIAFLVGQLIVWQELGAAGHFAASNPANAFFYVITAVHALHLLGGIGVWGHTVARLFSGAGADKVALGVHLTSVYWHYLLVVWMVMFALLLLT